MIIPIQLCSLEFVKKGIKKFLLNIYNLNNFNFSPVIYGKDDNLNVKLGFACFIIKTYWTIGEWEKFSINERHFFSEFIQSHQRNCYSIRYGYYGLRGFVDHELINYHISPNWYFNALKWLFPGHHKMHMFEKIIFAETKQAISTLIQIGEFPLYPYTSFPHTSIELTKFLQQYDWSKPWAAGGQVAAVAVFIMTQAPRFIPCEQVRRLQSDVISFLNSLSDPKTGGYFQGSQPEYGELINGSMKVLNALEWLETPILYPERLIDTCLSRLPDSEGCHLVDAIYVLYRCNLETSYRYEDIVEYCMKVFEMILEHKNEDGGFSYYIGKSQTSYYGVTISKGLPESDIHGTCLLTWAIAMIIDILKIENTGWKVIKA